LQETLTALILSTLLQYAILISLRNYKLNKTTRKHHSYCLHFHWTFSFHGWKSVFATKTDWFSAKSTWQKCSQTQFLCLLPFYAYTIHVPAEDVTAHSSNRNEQYTARCKTMEKWTYINTFAATELFRQLMCIGKCHWRVYSSFSICNSAVHRHHRT